MKDGIMRSIDLVSSVYVGGKKPLIVTCTESLDFVGGRMSAQHVCLVEVVGIRQRSPRVISGEAQFIEVHMSGDDG